MALGERKMGFGSALLWGCVGIGCSGEAVDPAAGPAWSVTRERIIFGADDRSEPSSQDGPAVPSELTRASVALIPASRLDLSIPSAPRLAAPTLSGRFGVCPDERFAQQPAAANCSGTLVTSDTILTAGHCVDTSMCPELRLVFDYAIGGAGLPLPLAAESLYSCAEVVVRRRDGVHDYAMIRLDRPVVDRMPVRVKVGQLPLEPNAPLFTIGHPSGVPQKISAHATVIDPRRYELDYFTTHLDSLPGSSGGGVFLQETNRLVGVLVRGQGDGYLYDATNKCSRPEQVSDDSELRVDSVYVAAAVAHYCSVRTDAVLCACGNGACEASLDETTASCAEDCGSLCGDGACNGAESGDNCYADCGRCGNAVCESREVARLSCCEDCGCPVGFGCDNRSCQPQLGNLNGDAAIDQRDAAALRAELFGLHPMPFHGASSDIDCSGSTDWADLAALEQVANGYDTKLPCVRVDSLALGPSHSCVALGSGAVRCWGTGSWGQLGYGATHVLQVGARTAPDVSVGARIVQVAVSQTHTCAMSDTGKVKCWGLGSFGQLGYANTATVGLTELPSEVGWVELSGRAAQIATGSMFSCAILEDGRVQCWGDNLFGQLGYGVPANVGDNETPATRAPLAFADRAVELALGEMHACARLASGAVHCWGANTFGQLGTGDGANVGDDEPAPTHMPVNLGAPASDIAVGALHSCALLVSGPLRCWGDNSMGQLGRLEPMPIGDDESPDSVEPVELQAGVSSVVAGAFATCVRYDSGAVTCWGSNLRGELGLGTSGSSASHVPPAQMPPVEIGAPVVEVFAGAAQRCGKRSSGDLVCWGANDVGQLGYEHRNDIGDDETPKAAGLVPLTGVNEVGWSFVNEHRLAVWLTDEWTDGEGTSITLDVSAPPESVVPGLTALLSFDTSEAPARVVELATRGDFEDEERNRLALEQEVTASLWTLRVDLGDALGDHGFAARLRLGFTDDGGGWRAGNDYAASERTFRRVPYPTQRVQVIDRSGNVIYGWRRDTRLAAPP